MMDVKIYVPISGHDWKLLDDDRYYRVHYQKDYEKLLSSVTFTHNNETFNVLVMLCFGSRDGNAWIDVTLWKKIKDVLVEIVTGDPMHGSGSNELEYEDVKVLVKIIGED